MFDKEKEDGPELGYYKERQSLIDDLDKSHRKLSQLGWSVGIGSTVIAVCLAIAIMTLVPLKTVEPYVVEVNRTTGETTVRKSLTEEGLEKVTAKEVLNKYWIIQYTKARLGFDITSSEHQYEVVRLMTDKKIFSEFHDYFNPKNKNGPFYTYGDRVKLKVEVKSITFLNENTALVRLDTIEGKNEKTREPKVATLAFGFSKTPSEQQERNINPLGFVISSWRVDDEVLKGE